MVKWEKRNNTRLKRRITTFKNRCGKVPEEERLKYKYSKCAICGFRVGIEIHHTDHNRNNNDIHNLIGLCGNHHKLVHSNKHLRFIKNSREKHIIELLRDYAKKGEQLPSDKWKYIKKEKYFLCKEGLFYINQK